MKRLNPYHFIRDKQANVALIFALVILPLCGLLGAALDYNRATVFRDELLRAADAASVSALSQSSPAMKAAFAMAGNGAITAGTTDAVNVFNSNTRLASGQSINSVTANVTKSGNSITSTVQFNAKVNSTILTLIGMPTISVSGTSTSVSNLPAFMDFYLLLDVSPSMGIGATQSDIDQMQASNGCAFACHSPAVGFPGYAIPDVPGTQLRIDVLRSATSQLISTAQTAQVVANQFRMGLYTFTNTVTTQSGLTTNLSQLQTLTNNIQLPTTRQGTQIGDSIDWLNTNQVTTSGTGTSASPIKFVFIVTDGVEDFGDNYTPGRYDNLPGVMGNWYGNYITGVMMSSACDSLKSKGVTVAVLYTTYAAMNDFRYTWLVQPFASSIPTALQNCASPGYFFQANGSTDLSAALQAMFAQAQTKPRISQ